MKEILRTRWVWNEQTQESEPVEYPTGKYKLDESDKIAIVSEYLQGHVPASQLIEKYGIRSRQTLFSWMDKYVNEKELVSLPSETNPCDPMEKKSAEDRLKELETEEGVCYLSLITDAYSHKIVGWSLGPTLETAYPLKALRMALSGIDAGTARGLIHHSDRGSQYCSDAYVSELRKWGIRISMTQSGDPLENAVAERANGILKSEWLYKMSIPDRATCKAELARIIDFYNTQRPHMSIGWQTPENVHAQSGEQRRCWRNYYRPQPVPAMDGECTRMQECTEKQREEVAV